MKTIMLMILSVVCTTAFGNQVDEVPFEVADHIIPSNCTSCDVKRYKAFSFEGKIYAIVYGQNTGRKSLGTIPSNTRMYFSGVCSLENVYDYLKCSNEASLAHTKAYNHALAKYGITSRDPLIWPDSKATKPFVSEKDFALQLSGRDCMDCSTIRAKKVSCDSKEYAIQYERDTSWGGNTTHLLGLCHWEKHQSISDCKADITEDTVRCYNKALKYFGLDYVQTKTWTPPTSEILPIVIDEATATDPAVVTQ